MADENKAHGLAWFIAGLGVGALIGVLYAPKAGRETREDLANSAREGSEYLRVRGREAAQQVSQFVDRGKEQVTNLVDRGREQAADFADRGRTQWEEFVERGKNLVAEQSSRIPPTAEMPRQIFSAGVGSEDPTDL